VHPATHSRGPLTNFESANIEGADFYDISDSRLVYYEVLALYWSKTFALVHGWEKKKFNEDVCTPIQFESRAGRLGPGSLGGLWERRLFRECVTRSKVGACRHDTNFQKSGLSAVGTAGSFSVLYLSRLWAQTYSTHSPSGRPYVTYADHGVVKISGSSTVI
jgi:hypothetical protein